MQKVKIVFTIMFFLIIMLPIATFNWEENAVSEIDNKVLAPNPLGENAGEVKDLTEALEIYVSERIGFRDQMILAYTVANDRLFGTMIHPSYMYGKDGYVFQSAREIERYSEYEDAYVNMLSKMQKYCDERNIPFVFVFEPQKESVLPEKLPDGYLYSREWVDTFMQKLKENGVNYVDNTRTMKEGYETGIETFNVKYDAVHWNDRGAFLGVNEALKSLKDQGANVHINTIDEYTITEELRTTLPVSEFPIEEYVPIFSLKNEDTIQNITDQYKEEIEVNPDFQHFEYYINELRAEDGAPKTLVFQGSHMNSSGYKFLWNGLGEYISVHNYQNVLDFEYYINIFKPECVIFDAAEGTFIDKYFDYEKMKAFDLHPLFATFDSFSEEKTEGTVEILEKNATTKIKLSNIDINGDYGYLIMDGVEYEMRRVIDEKTQSIFYEITLDNRYYDSASNYEIVIVDKTAECKYLISH